MASIRTIARKAGVSITTVSRVLNNHPQVSAGVRQRVLSVTHEAGYTPSVGKKSTTNIAILYTGENSIGSPFDGAILHGMRQGMEEHGYDLMVLDARRSRAPGETLSQMMLRKGVRGAVVRTTLPTREAAVELVDEGFPCVVVADRFEDDRVSYVYSDSAVASREAVEHLAQLGHRRIGIVLNMIDDTDHADRLAGYQQAIESMGIDVDPRLVFRTHANREGGVQLMRRLANRSDKPTALFLTDPMVAIGVLAEARTLGVRVPEDLSIIGFDDTDLRLLMSPGLTAVCQDAVAMGRKAFVALHGILEGERQAIRRALPTWLEIHQSTAPCGESPQR